MNAPNPFEVLYMGEEIDPTSFVQIFSPLLIHETLALFRAGNSVLMGTQGSGKSMLLTLLKPESRISFAKADVPYPVPSEVEFVGAGINLTRSGATDFGQRSPANVEVGEWETYFGDFLNYWIVRDILRSLRALQSIPSHTTPVASDPKLLDEFARELSRESVWLGSLEFLSSAHELEVALERRLREYRNFLNFNQQSLSDEIRYSKTEPGEPLSIAAEVMRRIGLATPATNVLIRIDQYEFLARESGMDDRFDFRSVVHKMMSSRDPRVSYKLGTRRYAWPEVPKVHGGGGRLEALRNFKIIDLDDILRSAEHDSGQFPRFAEDVFRRRLQWAGYSCPDPKKVRCVRHVFGPSASPHQAAARLTGKRYDRDALREQDTARTLTELVDLLKQLDPLSAQLGEAWILQKGDAERVPGDDEPWSSRKSPWWYKERIPLALTQLSANRGQRLVYAGAKDVVQLSGANILAFISICQFIWDAWLSEQENSRPDSTRCPSITSPYAQDEGIRQASLYWFEKIPSDADGHMRQRFVRHLGTLIRSWLRADKRMSNPGFNGFSLDIDELHEDRLVKSFLETAAAYGVLVDRRHTSKNHPGGPRVAWYLNAIYGPYFQIPVARQKEPRYVHTADVREWMISARILSPNQALGQDRLF